MKLKFIGEIISLATGIGAIIILLYYLIFYNNTEPRIWIKVPEIILSFISLGILSRMIHEKVKKEAKRKDI